MGHEICGERPAFDRRQFLASLGVSAVAAETGSERAAAELTGSGGPARLVAGGAMVSEPAREIPVTHRADVVVVGATHGGLGGCTAAIAAARRGAKVVLIEQLGHIDLHVPISLGIVIGIDGWLPTIHEGLFKDLAVRTARAGDFAAVPLSPKEVLSRGELIVRHHDVVVAALLEMLREAGVTLLFHTRTVGAALDGSAIRALVVESPRGRHAVAGSAFVDSTGLGDVAALAGAPMLSEEAFPGLQALIGGVDEVRYQAWLREDRQPLDPSYRAWLEGLVGPFDRLEYPWDQWWPEYLGDRMAPAVVRRVREAQSKGKLTLLHRRGARGVLAIPEGLKVRSEVAMPRTYLTGINLLDPDDVSWAEVQSRLSLIEFQRFLRTSIPGFEHSVLERVADAVGYRGGRYIRIERNPTRREIAAGGTSPDCVYLYRQGVGRPIYEVPYRVLVPQGASNLLVVGKATAGGVHLRAAHGVLFQGQAAGTAAALAISSHTPIGRVNVRELQDALRADGVHIPER